jgi:8-oxo-dGTP pyrophosphatase MutT (NUDIX family)
LTTSTAKQDKPKALRPKDAATLMLVDRKNARILMGKRSSKHVFMPDLYVFPGGRRDKNDWRLPVKSPLRDEVISHLLRDTSQKFTTSTATALALAAARELHEETSINIQDKVGFNLQSFRYFARAITPIGQARRFDTRFFVSFCDELEINASQAKDSEELVDLRWVNIYQPEDHPMPMITSKIIKQLQLRLKQSNDLGFDAPPYFYNKI